MRNQNVDKKWWSIATKGDPSKMLEDHAYIKQTAIPFEVFYAGFKRYYELYCYGSEWGMRKLYHGMQGAAKGYDVKLIGESEIPQEKVMESEELRFRFAPLLNELGLINNK